MGLSGELILSDQDIRMVNQLFYWSESLPYSYQYEIVDQK